MLLLLIFGFVAGAATAVSPCVVPVLPIALSAGATGGRRRPLGVVTGLVFSFTFALFALVYVISALGLPNDLLRNIAIVVLAGFGFVLLIPPLAARVEAYGSSLGARLGVRTDGKGDGFWSGVGLGLSLGVLYAPCAGPILAGVLTFSASQSFSAGRLAVVIAYAIGSAIVLYLLMIGGRKLAAPLARRSGSFQMAMGLVMVVVAFSMWQGYDTDFQSHVVAGLPSFLRNPAEGIEKTDSAQNALASIRGGGGHGLGLVAQEIQSEREAEESSGEGGSGGGEPNSGRKHAIPTGTGNSKFAPAHSRLTAKEEETVPLNDIGVAPEFTDTEDWFNTPGDKPLTMKGLRGKVVLIDFWTYSCINCIRTLPYLNAWYERYAKDGLVIVGVHTPEFPFEREASNVEQAIKTDGIKYPVVQDNEDGTWNAYGNLYWPAEYFVDSRGHVRFAHFGEGNYGEKEQVIRELLTEAGHPPGKKLSGAHGMHAEPTVTTPESYLGSARAENFNNGLITKGTHDFTLQPPGENELSYGGEWTITEQPVTAGKGAKLDLNFGARRVYLVLGSPGKPRRMKVLLDGKPIPPADDGADVHNGYVTVTDERLYTLVELPKVEHRTLELVPEEGVQGYAFTFG